MGRLRHFPLAAAVFRDFAGGILPLVVLAAGRAPLLGPSLSRDLHQQFIAVRSCWRPETVPFCRHLGKHATRHFTAKRTLL